MPARGGSKGVPGKNTRLLAGRPLLEYTARAALASGVLHRVVLSTDSVEIADCGRRAGLEVPFMRPPALAGDDTPMLPVVEHALDELRRQGWEPATVVLLQPTSPLRTPEHIRAISEAVRGLPPRAAPRRSKALRLAGLEPLNVDDVAELKAEMTRLLATEKYRDF